MKNKQTKNHLLGKAFFFFFENYVAFTYLKYGMF